MSRELWSSQTALEFFKQRVIAAMNIKCSKKTVQLDPITRYVVLQEWVHIDSQYFAGSYSCLQSMLSQLGICYMSFLAVYRLLRCMQYFPTCTKDFFRHSCFGKYNFTPKIGAYDRRIYLYKSLPKTQKQHSHTNWKPEAPRLGDGKGSAFFPIKKRGRPAKTEVVEL